VVNDPASPLLNRAALGRYRVGNLEQLFPMGFAPLQIRPAPPMRMDQLSDRPGEAGAGYSPLQMALAAATISAGGVRPAPQIVAAVKTPQAGWVPLEPLSEPVQALEPAQAALIAARNADPDQPIWSKTLVIAPGAADALTWFLGGTMPGQSKTPYAIAVVLEEQNPDLAEQIGEEVLAGLIN
jgi:hypothetical protein